MARRKPAVKLARYTAEYINARRDALMEAAGNRNAEMDRFERLYRLDVWENSKPADEQRISLPLAYDMIEKERALLLARPPQISVPPTGNGITERNRAQKIERYLYGVSDRTNLYAALGQAAWYANCLGQGWVKAAYDPNASDDDFPIIITPPDPRTIYHRDDARGEHCAEVVHTWERSRREIEAEFDVTLPDAPGDPDKVDAWLDEATCYTEYWTTESVWEDIDEEEEEEAKPLGVIEMAAEDYMRRTLAAQAPPPPGPDGAPTPTIGDYLETAPPIEVEEDEPAKKSKRRRVRKVIHAIVVGEGEDAVLIKKPVVMVDYKAIPFFGWAGIETPMANGRKALSMLFAATGGDSGDKATGVLQSYNLVASLYLDEAVKRVHAPLVTDDKEADIDLSPDAINTVSPGRNITFLQQPPVNTSLMTVGEMMSRMMDRVGPPEVWNGQAFNLSGQAISGLANAYQMRIAFKQHAIEKAMRNLFAHILCLTAHYSDPDDGWRAYGTGAYGSFVEEAVTADDIGDQYRVVVKLSASMPKDEIAQTSLFAQLLQSNAISWETFLDQFQKMWGLAADSPEDEIERTFTYMLLRDKSFAEDIARAKAQDFVELMKGLRGGVKLSELARAEALRFNQPPAPPKPAPPVLGPRPGEGLPPGSAPPTPDGMAAAGDLDAAAAMPGMLNAGGPRI